MSTIPPRLTRAEQRERTREKLLDAAADAFAEHGFEGASIDDIAARAGFTRGAFYSNFADKTELLVTLCDRRIAGFAHFELPRILAIPEEQRLAAVARWLAAEAPPLELLLVLELARQRGQSPDTAAALDRVVDRLLAGIEQLLAIGGEGLADLPDAEREVRARAVLAAVAGTNLLDHLGVDADARVIELLLAGIADPATSATGAGSAHGSHA